MRLLYIYDTNENNLIGYVVGLYTDDNTNNNMYYKIKYPRTSAIKYVNVNDVQMDDQGRLYYTGENYTNKLFIQHCRRYAGCTGCKYEQYNDCKQRFIKDLEG